MHECVCGGGGGACVRARARACHLDADFTLLLWTSSEAVKNQSVKCLFVCLSVKSNTFKEFVCIPDFYKIEDIYPASIFMKSRTF